MKIEFWSDIICPWCGLTEHRLERALHRFEHGDEVEIIHRSFQVHPDLPRHGVTQRELMAMHGIDPTLADTLVGPIERFARQEGLAPYEVIERNLGPTDHAHAFLAYATDQGLHAQAWKAMFRAHFGAGRTFWTIDDIVQFAVELGLDAAETREALESGRYTRQVDEDQARAQQLGVSGTPFILIDGRYAVTGARDTDALLGAMRQAWRQSHAPEKLMQLGDAGDACDVNGCV